MKRIASIIIFVLAISPLFAQHQDILLTDWQFSFNEHIPATHGYNPVAFHWTDVKVPHDWAIYGPFDRENDIQTTAVKENFETKPRVKTGRTGGLPYMQKALYKTTIHIAEEQLKKGNHFTLLFDGVMSQAQVFVNGQKVIYWPYGYASFYKEITPYLKAGDNEIEVAVENQPQSSRWYPGAGIYRNVHLISTGPAYIPVWGTQVTTDVTADLEVDSAALHLKTKVLSEKKQKIQVVIELQGHYFMHRKVMKAINTKEREVDVTFNYRLSDIGLWSPEHPNLYNLRIEVYANGKLSDVHEEKIGFRKVAIIPNEGFALNGQVRKFQGVCLHHDQGPLGAVANRDAIRHQLLMMKDMGCDAIRTSHNMPAPELVELCDSIGLMVMCEAFDEWDVAKCNNGYHRFFNEVEDGQDKPWAERDMVNMLHQYRNHPSVVMWSIGNEVPSQCDENGAQTLKFLQDICHREDPTRPVTCGLNKPKCFLENGFANDLEVLGINYHLSWYPQIYETLPQKLILSAETGSTVSSRGVYKFPVRRNDNSQLFNSFSAEGDGKNFQCSSYDMEYCTWSNTPDDDFAMQEDLPWTMGQFVWTGFDYIGEPTPYDNNAWPAHTSYFGMVDLASIPKDRFWLFRSVWNKREHTLHLLPHWNWNEGDAVPVMVYTDYPEAELFLNGRSLGRQHKLTAEQAAADTTWGVLKRYRLIWDAVPFEAGELKAVAYNYPQGEAVMETAIRTAGAPARIELIPDQAGQLTYVRVRITDKDGNLCPNADNLVHFTTTGPGRFVCAANGDATNLDLFHLPQHHAFSGQLTAIVEGNVVLEASAKGLKTARIHIGE
ncbi:MAG: DUF4982 domain-containing protein [Bacteroidales bacterium]|nr:DUF4982 domain-containing protein [Bacteroidales bacterium]